MGRARAAHAAGQVGGGGAGLSIGLIQAGKGFRDAGMAIGELVELDPVEFHAGEQRVGGSLAQVGQQLLVGFLGKGADIHVERVGEREQHARRHGALIAFKQVEIARRQAECRGSLGLGEPALAAQAAQAGAGEDLLERLGFAHGLYQK